MTRITIGALVVGMAFAAGCKSSSDRQDVQSERETLLQERQELSEVRTEEQQKLQEELGSAREDFQQEQAELRQGTQEEIAGERQDVAEAEQDLAETRQEYRQQGAEETAPAEQGVGGAGEAGMTYSGTIESKKADKLTLKTPEGTQELLVTPDTEFTHLGNDITIADIPEGSNVRASYEMKADKKVADRVEVLMPKK